ncbi:hypothetical protein CROQUDRAFT_663542 [Cronartium quercuum f. sp. fusiforme G11]|uniref:Uncharacterized protein n=1 Tax=Cronartium quercuum f. sp. fusiforme G11 TaxID=708437 RepID=A0A9P6NDE6_9BASI|nr:hypothetical protein CROQUDRAFT_663542 [Cronartium quercuum f. sp. fusiforme G11]
MLHTSTTLYAFLCSFSLLYAQQVQPGIQAQQQQQQQQAQLAAQQGQQAPVPFFAMQALAQSQGVPGQLPVTQSGQLTLNPTQINQASLMTGNEGGGKSTPSAQSPNNFINFCEGQTLTNGLMNEQGSCNPIPMGSIPAKERMPSVRFVSPVNLQRLEPNQPIEIRMSVRNFITGSTTNPATAYYTAPQQLGPNGIVIGHLHLIVDRIQRGTQQAPDISAKPALFKAVANGADANGIISFPIDGFPDGEYRISTLATSSNHAAIALPVAERGSMDDSIYIFVGSAASILQTAANTPSVDQVRAGISGGVPNPGTAAGQRPGQVPGQQPTQTPGQQPQIPGQQPQTPGQQPQIPGQVQQAGQQVPGQPRRNKRNSVRRSV